MGEMVDASIAAATAAAADDNDDAATAVPAVAAREAAFTSEAYAVVICLSLCSCCRLWRSRLSCGISCADAMAQPVLCAR